MTVQRREAVQRRSQMQENRTQLKQLENVEPADIGELLDIRRQVIDTDVSPVPLRGITKDEKAMIINKIMATPKGTRARTEVMDELHDYFMNMADPPYLAPSYRNLWSQWVSAYDSNTVAKSTGIKGRPKGVIAKDGLNLLQDIHGYWVRTGNGSKRHQVKKNVNEISHRRRGHGLNLDQMRLQGLIVESNGQVCCVCVCVCVRALVCVCMYVCACVREDVHKTHNYYTHTK